MAERKSGPVKPPVLDLKARPAAAESKPEAEAAPAEPARPTPPPPPPPRPPARLAMPWSAISIAAVGGALLGTALTYGLVNFVPLADKRPQLADPAPRLDGLDAGLADLVARLTATEEQQKRTQLSLDATIAQLDAGLVELRQSIAALPGPAAVDLAPLEQELASLESRITAIGAGASSAEASTLATTIAALETGLADLKARLDGYQQRFAATDGSLARLETALADARAAISAQSSTLGGAEIGPAVRLPLIVSGLESAFTNGRPYATELAGLTTLLPDLAIPEPVSAAAAAGLPRPDALATRFSAAVPDILAGRAATSSGDLGQDALEWMKGLLALRPTGEIEGDGPEAVISRLEPAVGRGDFEQAAGLLALLPAPMQAAAGPIGDDIRALAAAQGFIAGLRTEALSPVAEATP